MKTLYILFFFSFFILADSQLHGQKRSSSKKQNTISYDESLYDAIEWRSIGPYRGGRSAAVTGVEGQPNLYYFGATGGGVWRTKDGGQYWENISDGFFGGSIGAVTVAPSDPNVIYVGGGEVTIRGNVSYGYGVYKSVDAGETWTHIGLDNSRHIPRIRVHPDNPDIVYAAVLGDLYKPTEERGVYKSIDGGQTWKKVLFSTNQAGAVDLLLDPNNPRIIYASTWKVFRTPYSLSSGGEGSGLWKSKDGGETWENISDREGLPKGLWGISGIAISPVNSDRMWVILENENGGVYRSDDGGKKWSKVNSSRSLRQRAWYYSRIYADTKDEDIVYVVNVRYHKSKDGGKTFEAFAAPHGDHHDMWIAPEDSDRMIMADDGGAQVTFDGGQNWSTYHNQPTAQYYRITTDDHFPYRIYVAQQDNSTQRVYHRTNGSSIGERDWESTAGGESAHIAPDPDDNDIVYGGSYGGFLTRVNHRTKQTRAVNVWPDNPMGYGAEGMRFRFQWNFPIFFSPHDGDKLYTTSNRVHVSYNEGQSWEIISPDLTRNDPEKLGPSGGPITKDNTAVEYYCTVFAAAESPRVKNVIWAGSDDGLVHVTKDGGKNWENVTPSNMPDWIMVNSIEPDPHSDGGCYVAATMYKNGDYRPYLFKTKDFGQTWTKITNGINDEHFTRVIRTDPNAPGLLYAGTETGMYISFDDGMSWGPFQLNLPVVPITDLVVKNNNLIVATQGRSIWLIDDLTPLHQLSAEIANQAVTLFKPMDSYRMGGSQNKNVKNAGLNHPGGVMVYYYLAEMDKEDEVSINILETSGDTIVTYNTKADDKKFELKAEKGSNYFNWNMRYPGATSFDGMIMWAASMDGPKAPPGEYIVDLNVNGESKQQRFRILKDPRSVSTQDDFEAQFTFLKDIRKTLTEAHESIIEMRDIKNQINNYKERMPDEKEVKKMALEIDSVMNKIENELYQTKNRSRQDPLNYPIKLTNKLGHLNSLIGRSDFKPTDQAYEVKEELTKKITDQLKQYQDVKNSMVPRFNELVRSKQIDAIIIKKKDKPVN